MIAIITLLFLVNVFRFKEDYFTMKNKRTRKRLEAIKLLGDQYSLIESSILYQTLASKGYWWNSVECEWVKKKCVEEDGTKFVACNFRTEAQLYNEMKEHCELNGIFLREFMTDAIKDKLHKPKSSGDNETQLHLIMTEIKNTQELLVRILEYLTSPKGN